MNRTGLTRGVLIVPVLRYFYCFGTISTYFQYCNEARPLFQSDSYSIICDSYAQTIPLFLFFEWPMQCCRIAIDHLFRPNYVKKVHGSADIPVYTSFLLLSNPNLTVLRSSDDNTASFHISEMLTTENLWVRVCEVRIYRDPLIPTSFDGDHTNLLAQPLSQAPTKQKLPIFLGISCM